jgi:hypothetical protein
VLDSIAKLMPLVTVAGGAAASSPNIKAQLEKMLSTTKVVAVQTEVNNIAQMVYLEMIDEKPVKPEEFAEYLRRNMRTKGKVVRDTSLDMWETPYGLAYDEKNHRLYVISAGPDKQYNTDDDVYASYAY